jgi:hypothetical protein
VVGNRLVRTATLALVASLLLYGGACSSDSPSPEPEGEAPDIEGVVYLGETNDEGLLVLLGATLSPASSPRVTRPEDGAVLAEPVTFTFESGTTARLEPVLRGPRPRPHFAFGALFGPERLAHAHGVPMNGEAYLLTFSTAEEPHLLRIFTDIKSYEPDEYEWNILAAAGSVTLTVRMGVFEEGRLPGGAGPFESAPLHFPISGS